jgi:hypothetical protein
VVLSLAIPSFGRPTIERETPAIDDERDLIDLSGPPSAPQVSYHPPVFEHPQPRIGRAPQSPTPESSPQHLLEPTPTPDSENPLLPPVLPGFEGAGEPVGMQAFGALGLDQDTELGWDRRVGTGPSDQSYPVAAYNSTSEEYLIVWMDDADTQNLHASILSRSGEVLQVDFQVPTSGVGLPRQPEVAYNESDNSYLLLWSEPRGV